MKIRDKTDQHDHQHGERFVGDCDHTKAGQTCRDAHGEQDAQPEDHGHGTRTADARRDAARKRARARRREERMAARRGQVAAQRERIAAHAGRVKARRES